MNKTTNDDELHTSVICGVCRRRIAETGTPMRFFKFLIEDNLVTIRERPTTEMVRYYDHYVCQDCFLGRIPELFE